MATGCAPGSGGATPIGDLLALADCRATALGWGGYQAIGHGSWFAAISTGLLTLAVALQGYRLLAGHTPDLRHGLGLMLRIGLATALSTGTTAYGTLIYRVATNGPFELAARLSDAAGLAADDLPARLDRLYTVIRLDPETRGRLATTGGSAAAPVSAAASSDGGQRGAGIALAMVSAGPWIALRFTMALLLAFGPLAALMLLFEATVGVFVNWLRALGGMAIALTGLALAIPIELEALEPVAAQAGTGTPDYTAIVAILGVFGIVSAAILIAAHRMTAMIPLPTIAARDPATVGPPAPVAPPAGGTPAFALADPAATGTAGAPPRAAVATRSNAAAVSGALAASAARRSGGALNVTVDGGRLVPRPAGSSAQPPSPQPAFAAGLAGKRRAVPQLRLSADRTSPR